MEENTAQTSEQTGEQKQEQTGMELAIPDTFLNDGRFIAQQQGVDGAKSTSISVAKAKAIAEAFGLPVKSEEVKLKRQRAMEQVKVHIVKTAGDAAVNPDILGVSEKVTVNKSGDKRIVLTMIEPHRKTASEQAIADFLGLTLADVRKLHADKLRKEQAIDIPAGQDRQ